MASFRIEILPSAEKEFRSVPFPVRRQVNQRIMRLKADPRPPDSDHLTEAEKYRLSVHGWAILYEIDDRKTLVTIWAVLRA